MEDARIVALFWERREQALEEVRCAYGAYCRTIALRIVGTAEDADECVNDTWLRLWRSIPPQKPARLGAYISKITRRLAIDRLDYNHAEKRGSDSARLAFEELAACIPGGDEPERALEQADLCARVNHFVGALPKRQREIFLSRYFYAQSAREIARAQGITEAHVDVILCRVRKALKQALMMEGYL